MKKVLCDYCHEKVKYEDTQDINCHVLCKDCLKDFKDNGYQRSFGSYFENDIELLQLERWFKNRPRKYEGK